MKNRDMAAAILSAQNCAFINASGHHNAASSGLLGCNCAALRPALLWRGSAATVETGDASVPQGAASKAQANGAPTRAVRCENYQRLKSCTQTPSPKANSHRIWTQPCCEEGFLKTHLISQARLIQESTLLLV